MMKLNKSLLLIIGLIAVAYGNAGQGIGNNSDSLESEEIAEAVKQEVYLKTAEAEPIEIGEIKTYSKFGRGASSIRARRHNHDGIGGGVSPHSNHDSGIGSGASLHNHHDDGIGSGAGPSHRRPHSDHNDGINPYGSGIGGGAQPGHHHNSNSAHRSNQQPEPRGHHHQRRHISEYNRFDSGYSKDCNSYYGRLICYKIYSNPSMPVGNEMTCWRISGNRKNCTEIENINYLRQEGFTPHESEFPKNKNHNIKDTEKVINGQSQQYDSYKPNYNGADQYPVARNTQRGTHKFSTSGLNLNNDSESFEDNDSAELVREKRGTRKNNFKIDKRDYEDTINSINVLFAEAEEVCWASAMETLVSFMAKLILWVFSLAVAVMANPFPDLVTPSIAIPKTTIDCQLHGDGNYAYGCSSTFYQCFSGRLHTLTCFDNLVFDPANNACEHESKIEVCRSGLKDNPKAIKVYGHFSCDGKPQGLYFLACNGAYAYCDVVGNRKDRSCPPGTALDEKRQACDWTEHIAACNGAVVTTPTSLVTVLTNFIYIIE
ncbi:hypothetical protein FO519_001642 [Halicephalobus sp. NKZ332]|nr:hypothetical protein FO519_001642 [Halicephalobus sp. NKZ332]